VGLMSFLPLSIASALTEHNQWPSAIAAGWPFVAAMLFAALVVSVFAHTCYYMLIDRYEANLLAPLTLMTPLSTIGFGVMITGDRLDARLIVGSALALLGVLIIVVRRNQVAPLLLVRERS
ncbi:MAG TPA: EamA family transporter, partial [Sphingomonas sp.]